MFEICSNDKHKNFFLIKTDQIKSVENINLDKIFNNNILIELTLTFEEDKVRVFGNDDEHQINLRYLSSGKKVFIQIINYF